MNTKRGASRIEYTISYGVVVVLGLVLPYLISVRKLGGSVGLWAGSLALVLAAVIWFVQAIRRLHDMGYSGTRVLWMFVPVVNIVFPFVLMAWPPAQRDRSGSAPSPEDAGLGG